MNQLKKENKKHFLIKRTFEDDAVQKILKKYEFTPEYFPDIKNLFTTENSIHILLQARRCDKNTKSHVLPVARNIV